MTIDIWYWPVQPVWRCPALFWNIPHWVWSLGTGGWGQRPSSLSRWSVSSWGTWCRHCGRSSSFLSFWNGKSRLCSSNTNENIIQSILGTFAIPWIGVYHSPWWSELNQCNLISSTLLIFHVALFVTSTGVYFQDNPMHNLVFKGRAFPIFANNLPMQLTSSVVLAQVAEDVL